MFLFISIHVTDCLNVFVKYQSMWWIVSMFLFKYQSMWWIVSILSVHVMDCLNIISPCDGLSQYYQSMWWIVSILSIHVMDCLNIICPCDGLSQYYQSMWWIVSMFLFKYQSMWWIVWMFLFKYQYMLIVMDCLLYGFSLRSAWIINLAFSFGEGGIAITRILCCLITFCVLSPLVQTELNFGLWCYRHHDCQC